MIEWVRSGQWFEQSDCGRYKVCAVKVGGKYQFQAWRGSRPGELLWTGEAAKCREVCEAERTGVDALEAERNTWRNCAYAKQAHIDRLMLEFCPGEMLASQREEWARHQVSSLSATESAK